MKAHYPPPSALSHWIHQAHQLYCQLTGQNLSLRFDRERMWFEIYRLGYSLDQVRAVILYLQKEIRHQRRNVGALKLSNLLQPDRFEEDLNISSLRLAPPPRSSPQAPSSTPPASTTVQGRQQALAHLRKLKQQLGFLKAPPLNPQNSTDHSANTSTD